MTERRVLAPFGLDGDLAIALGANDPAIVEYGLVNATWGAFPGHPLDNIESGRGVVHNGLLLDHPQRSVVRQPFTQMPVPAYFTDRSSTYELGRKMTRFEHAPSLLKIPSVALTAFKG